MTQAHINCFSNHPFQPEGFAFIYWNVSSLFQDKFYLLVFLQHPYINSNTIQNNIIKNFHSFHQRNVLPKKGFHLFKFIYF